jgi:hypothetical protein
MMTCTSAIMAGSIMPSFIIQPGIALVSLPPIIGIPLRLRSQPATRVVGAAMMRTA